MKRVVLGLLAALGLVAPLGCGGFSSPVSPSGSKELPAWKPCVIVQNPGSRGSQEFTIQMDAVRRLHAAGRMDWIRLGGTRINGDGRDYAIEAKSMGLKVFVIVPTDDLEGAGSWERGFDQFYSMYPEADLWEIGGEISNPAINRKTLTPEYYMARLTNLYSYAKTRYPSARFVSAPTFGSVGGPTEFERFLELGLLDLDIIPAVNIYTENVLQQYAVVADRYAARLAKKRVWVTETGTDDPNAQVRWVEEFYPEIVNIINPSMICWYVMWEGDSVSAGGDGGYGLLRGVTIPPYRESPLFQKLLGGVR